MADTFFSEHRVGCVVGIACTVIFGIAGILASALSSSDFRIAIGLQNPDPSPDRGAATPSPSPSATITPTPEPPSPSTEPTNFPQPSPSTRPSASPSVIPPSTESSATERSRAPANDIGKGKANDFYEITVENAWASKDQVSFGICNFNVPSEQQAILVRLTIRLLTPPRTYEEAQRLANPQITDFILMDGQNRRLDPRCQGNGNPNIYLNSFLNSNTGNASTLTLAYLVPSGSEHLSFRFQKSGGGRPIVFDLSGVN
jgi:hypothetical protein